MYAGSQTLTLDSSPALEPYQGLENFVVLEHNTPTPCSPMFDPWPTCMTCHTPNVAMVDKAVHAILIIIFISIAAGAMGPV